MRMKGYQRFLTPKFTPFDPLQLAKETEKIVTREGPEGLERKYVGIYSAPVYRGIATGYAAGCCLRCVYCWSNWSRDFPEKFGKFYSPREVAQRLFRAAQEGIRASGWERYRGLKIEKLRLSGCEPTLGKDHMLSVLRFAKDSEYPLFILETNGILLGADRDYVRSLTEVKEKLYVRVSFKAATPEGFTKRTGAIGDYYELPFKALQWLLDEGIYARAAAMTDLRVMPKEERQTLIKRLNQIYPRLGRELEEEQIDRYDTTVNRLKASIDPEFAKRLEKRIREL
ncbi:MAG: molybdenum cofactor biosynthesis protein MoaA [bacterium (Candidatus Stahlbacteria) CG23_combo_of_CG06-09_8_20_14_all_40_9]|nr:MAG: molybdenum cofactor biosynthesis protein MoaA [bacterium (Candidatus Stahlbacteria) CG23_combo_of_CG06-09_8_20_14_all_40_9]